MQKYRRHIVTVIIGLFFAGVMLIPVAARADLPRPVPEECVTYVEESEAYFLQVISNYQNDLDFALQQRDESRAAMDRMHESFVARNWEYAAALETIRKLTDEVTWKTQLIEKQRATIRRLRNK